MTQPTLRFILPLLSLFGVLSIFINKKSLRNSNVLAYVNVVKIVFVFIFWYLTISDAESRKNVFKSDITLLNYSKFTQIIFAIWASTNQLITDLLCFYQFWKRHEIVEFLINLRNLKIEEKYSKKMKSTCTLEVMHFYIPFIVFYCLLIIVNIKLAIGSICIFVTLSYPYMVQANFYLFVKSMELIFYIILKDFKTTLKKALRKGNLAPTDLFVLSEKYQQIFELNRTFNKTFGTQITMLTVCLTTVVTCQVKRLINLLCIDIK